MVTGLLAFDRTMVWHSGAICRRATTAHSTRTPMETQGVLTVTISLDPTGQTDLSTMGPLTRKLTFPEPHRPKHWVSAQAGVRSLVPMRMQAEILMASSTRF